MNKEQNEIIIYKTKDGKTEVDIKMQNETMWLRQEQIAMLFGIDRTGVARHINNIFKSNELKKQSNVQKMHIANSDKLVSFYNLDVVISVGYRVNSIKATQFRIWTTKTLKNYLTNGYVINENKLKQQQEKFAMLQQSISLLNRTISNEVSNLKQAKNVSNILNNFVNGLNLLDDYDHQLLDKTGKTKRKAKEIKVEEFLKVINEMKGNFASDVFAVPKDNSFESSVKQIYQTFAGQELYPTLEEKATMLLYLITKNHSFCDGNKRIAASCFLYFLNKNKMLYNKKNETIIDNATLFSLTLLIAQSNPKDKDIIKQIIISVLNRKEND